jgi:Flp pilus assembly pilin Flp
MSRTSDDQPLTVETVQDELGQTMVEYGLLVSLISVALIVVLSVTGFGGALSAYYDDIVAGI